MEEYRLSESEGYCYSRFCDLFLEFERRLSPVMVSIGGCTWQRMEIF
jgi:hypothetical protein